jgi:CRP-like cAMP-binding protein
MNIPISLQLEKLLNIRLESDFITAIDQNAYPKRFAKGSIIIHQGDELDTLYYIKQGLVRGYYLDENGYEVTKCFSAESEFAGSEGFMLLIFPYRAGELWSEIAISLISLLESGILASRVAVVRKRTKGRPPFTLSILLFVVTVLSILFTFIGRA